MHKDLTDSNEDLYSLSTGAADLFDFSPPQTYIDSGVFALPKTSNSKLASIFSLIKSVVVGVGGLIFEICRFLFVIVKYINLKVLRVVNFLDISKDKIVDTLMWRR